MDGLKNGKLAKTIRNNYESLKTFQMIDWEYKLFYLIQYNILELII
jgi:hypothetical protein